MQINEILNLVGLILNIVGSIILAVSLSKFLTSLHGTVVIHDLGIQALINRKDKVLVGDVANLLKTGSRNSKMRTTFGLMLLIIGFILQLIPYIILLSNHFTRTS